MRSFSTFVFASKDAQFRSERQCGPLADLLHAVRATVLGRVEPRQPQQGQRAETTAASGNAELLRSRRFQFSIGWALFQQNLFVCLFFFFNFFLNFFPYVFSKVASWRHRRIVVMLMSYAYFYTFHCNTFWCDFVCLICFLASFFLLLFSSFLARSAFVGASIHFAAAQCDWRQSGGARLRHRRQ